MKAAATKAASERQTFLAHTNGSKNAPAIRPAMMRAPIPKVSASLSKPAKISCKVHIGYPFRF